MIAAPTDAELERQVTSLPYQLRTQFGDAATLWLQRALAGAKSPLVRLSCARELMRAGDPAGFAFALDAIGQERPWRSEIRQAVIDQFPETKNDTDAQMVAFLAERAK